MPDIMKSFCNNLQREFLMSTFSASFYEQCISKTDSFLFNHTLRLNYQNFILYSENSLHGVESYLFNLPFVRKNSVKVFKENLLSVLRHISNFLSPYIARLFFS